MLVIRRGFYAAVSCLLMGWVGLAGVGTAHADCLTADVYYETSLTPGMHYLPSQNYCVAPTPFGVSFVSQHEVDDGNVGKPDMVGWDIFVPLP
jgi:hypothetical protein